jgi:hypothetical protein
MIYLTLSWKSPKHFHEDIVPILKNSLFKNIYMWHVKGVFFFYLVRWLNGYHAEIEEIKLIKDEIPAMNQ